MGNPDGYYSSWTSWRAIENDLPFYVGPSTDFVVTNHVRDSVVIVDATSRFEVKGPSTNSVFIVGKGAKMHLRNKDGCEEMEMPKGAEALELLIKTTCEKVKAAMEERKNGATAGT